MSQSFKFKHGFMNSFLGTCDLLVLPKKNYWASPILNQELCVQHRMKKNTVSVLQDFTPQGHSQHICLQSSMHNSCFPLPKNWQKKSYIQVFKYKILIRNWEQKVLLQKIAHNKMKSYSVYLRRKFRFKEQSTCSSSVFFLCL